MALRPWFVLLLAACSYEVADTSAMGPFGGTGAGPGGTGGIDSTPTLGGTGVGTGFGTGAHTGGHTGSPTTETGGNCELALSDFCVTCPDQAQIAADAEPYLCSGDSGYVYGPSAGLLTCVSADGSAYEGIYLKPYWYDSTTYWFDDAGVLVAVKLTTDYDAFCGGSSMWYGDPIVCVTSEELSGCDTGP